MVVVQKWEAYDAIQAQSGDSVRGQIGRWRGWGGMGWSGEVDGSGCTAYLPQSYKKASPLSLTTCILSFFAILYHMSPS